MTEQPHGLYAGEYKSAIVRAKRILLAAGFAWSKTTGRYPNHVTTRGVRVTRVGCGDAISLHVHNGTYGSREERRDIHKRAIAALRAGGLPFDDRGWLECGPRARARLAAGWSPSPPPPPPPPPPPERVVIGEWGAGPGLWRWAEATVDCDPAYVIEVPPGTTARWRHIEERYAQHLQELGQLEAKRLERLEAKRIEERTR